MYNRINYYLADCTMDSKQKIFLVINLSFFGDVLLTNSLCQNIKLNYPDSKIVFVVNKPFYEVAKYQKDVDEVICFDKKGVNKGFWGILRFIMTFPYRNKIDTAFILYGNDRGIIISYLLKCKNRISCTVKATKYLLTTNTFEPLKYIRMQDRNGSFITALTGEDQKILPVHFLTNPENNSFAQKLKKQLSNKTLIGLCTVGKHKENYMPLETAAEIIERLDKDGKTVLYFGTGRDCRKYADELKKYGCVNFVDLTDVTTIYQLANVMRLCRAVISIDTGTVHLAYSSGVPTVGVFYRPAMVEKWAPQKDIYPYTEVVDRDYTPESILDKLNLLLKISDIPN